MLDIFDWFEIGISLLPLVLGFWSRIFVEIQPEASFLLSDTEILSVWKEDRQELCPIRKWLWVFAWSQKRYIIYSSNQILVSFSPLYSPQGDLFQTGTAKEPSWVPEDRGNVFLGDVFNRR
jgi:hypothetical protein